MHKTVYFRALPPSSSNDYKMAPLLRGYHPRHVLVTVFRIVITPKNRSPRSAFFFLGTKRVNRERRDFLETAVSAKRCDFPFCRLLSQRESHVIVLSKEASCRYKYKKTQR